MNFKGKHAFVTGAGKRVGRTLAEALIRGGVRVTAHYRNSKKEVLELCDWAKSIGQTAIPVQADLTDIASLKRAVSESVSTLGPLHVLINNASEFHSTPTLNCTEEQWDSLLDSNLKGQFFLAQAAAPHLMKEGGVILNIVDIHAQQPLANFFTIRRLKRRSLDAHP